jgi:ubiquinone/menaquinone biosynthesis C-methylase UbiE
MINKSLLELLCCPCCHSDLILTEGGLTCLNPSCQNTYPIIEDIPIMVPPKLRDQEHFDQQQTYFNSEFKKYKSYKLENWRLCYLSKIFSDLDLLENDLYLDIGVGGSGYTVIEFAKKGYFSVGIDISLEGLLKSKSFAESQLNDKINLCNFVLCHGEKLPFKNCSFDKISAVSVLEHFVDDDAAVSEVSRILGENGRFWINVPNAFKDIYPIFWLPYYIHDKRIGHLRHYDCAKLMQKFSKYGLDCLNVKYSAHMIKIIQSILSMILPKLNYQRSGLWWKLESYDSKLEQNKYGLNLTMLLIKKKS